MTFNIISKFYFSLRDTLTQLIKMHVFHLFVLFSEFCFLLNVYKRGLVKKPQAHVILRLLRFFFLGWGSSGGGGGPPAGAGPPAPMLQRRLRMFTLARASANKPGQKGSSTPAALTRADLTL